MMFNLPLPGGTTGHAVGIAMAVIVLGPWGATIAISVALAIQALIFGDGGILALGANCFNMAVAGVWTAAAVYRLIAGRSPIDARRRVVAGGLAGYAAINVAALLTAFELGIQPLLFHDASGAALYAPYPLAALLLITPVLYGMVIGFLLLDQRDDQTLVALQVTPREPSSLATDLVKPMRPALLAA